MIKTDYLSKRKNNISVCLQALKPSGPQPSPQSDNGSLHQPGVSNGNERKQLIDTSLS